MLLRRTQMILYSLLQYKHSLLREEVFNIGIAFYFPDMDNSVVFFHPTSLEILKNFYPDIDLATLQNYLKYISSSIQSHKLTLMPDIPIDLNFKVYLKNYALLEDYTVLQFSDPVIISNIDSDDMESILTNYIKILLSFKDGGEYNQIRNILESCLSGNNN